MEKNYYVYIIGNTRPTMYIEDAILREKQLKHWNREWKIELIRKANPKFRDLYPGLIK